MLTPESYCLGIPEKYQHQVEMFLALLETKQIKSLSELIKKDGTELIFDSRDRLSPDLEQLWAKVVSYLQPPTTKTLLKQQAKLVDFDFQLLDSAVIEFASQKLMKLQGNKLSNVKQAFKDALGVDVNVEFTCEGLAVPVEELPAVAETKPGSVTFFLTEDQERGLIALYNFVRGSETLFRLQGYAGTGKSFLVCQFIRWLKSQGISYLAACPTNKASKNLRKIAESAGIDLEVKTVAQLLGQQPELNEQTGKEEFVCNGSTNFADYRVVIIDEFSMVNRENFREIISEAKSHGCKVLFVGDHAQLPPINEGEPMAATYQMLSATLSEIVRYDGDLARIAEAVRSKPVLPPFDTTADKTLVCLPEAEWLKRAFDLFDSEEFDADSDYVRLLAWRNKTVDALNHAVRLHLWGESVNPFVPGDRLIARKPLFRLKPGAKGKNKWGIFINNSEEVIVTEAGKLTELIFAKDIYQYWNVQIRLDGRGRESSLLILHENSRQLHSSKVKEYATKKQWSAYFDLSRMFDDVGYAYALTVHKAQGSTIGNVFLDVDDMKRSSDRKKLIYTALTRTQKQAFVVC